MRLWVGVSDMGLEERCGDEEDMHVSTASIPILREEKAGIVEENSPAETQVIRRLEERLENPAAPQWPPIVYAPIDDPEFWLEFHNAVQRAGIQQLRDSDVARQLAEARILLIQNDLDRQYADKIRLGNQLENVSAELAAVKKQSEQQIADHLRTKADIFAKYINLVYLLGIERDQHETTVLELEKAVEQMSNNERKYYFGLLCAANEVEARELIIKMYEERFGTREELMKLGKAEENTKLPGTLGPRKYADISAIIKQHQTGKQKTVGQRIGDFAEKLLSPDTYGNIARAIYRAFKKEEKK